MQNGLFHARILRQYQSVILVASATNENDISDTNSSPDISRCILLELAIAPAGIQLNRLGQWDLGGPAKGGIIHEESHGVCVTYTVLMASQLKPKKRIMGTFFSFP